MLTLLSEARFWTYRNDISIKDNDFGAYRYHTKNASSKSSIHKEGKADYAARRGMKIYIDNKRPIKLKNCIKQLEDDLKVYKIVYCQWKDNCILQLMLSNGLLVHICVNIFTGDILRIAFDKYFIGKLISETIVDVIITRLHIIISYNENQITFVYLQKPNMKRSAPEKISRMDPKIFNIIIGGPQGRKIPRFLSCNGSYDLLVIWTKSSQNEVYPWRPTVRDQDRANIHVYKFNRTKLELLSYHWTEYDPICVEFSKLNHNQFKSVEQKISKKGDVTIENCTYDIVNSTIQRISTTSIPLQTQVCCHSLSPDYEKLMLGCIDGSVLLFDESRGITHHVKAAFIPTQISWHCDSALVMIANDRCQLQCFDISLACVKNQLISEDMTPSNILDLSGYFTYQPTLSKLSWSKKPELALYNEKYVQTDSFLLLLYENGPISCLRFFGGSGLKGDIHTSGFTADVLISKYLSLNQVEKSINVLLCLNWDTYGAMCLISLHKIANYIFKHPLTMDRENQIQKALGSFHIPVKPLCQETETEFGDQVRDITRKFFFYLLRYKSYEKAFSLAIDIDDVDLFMDLYNYSKMDGLSQFAVDCFKKAEEIYNRPSSPGSDHSTCSRSSCSVCTGSFHSQSEVEEDDIKLKANISKNQNEISLEKKSNHSYEQPNHNYHIPPLPKIPMTNNYVPPLPYLTNLPKEMKINIPKPELKVSPSTSSLKVKSQSTLAVWKPNTSANTNEFNRLNDPTLSSTYYTSTKTISSSQASKRNLIKINKIPLTSHLATDIIPKPSLRNVQSTISIKENREWSNIPDQTLGIPLTNTTYNATNRTSLSMFPPNSRNNSTASSKRHIYPSNSIPSAFNNIIDNCIAPPIIHQYPLISGNIPQITAKSYNSTEVLNRQRHHYLLPPSHHAGTSLHQNISLYTNQESTATGSILSSTTTNQNSTLGSQKKESGEKNKVKFSDTITVAVVPEIPRKERLKRTNGYYPMVTDPKRELADSLPLCHPNDEYLKDFTPMAEINNDNSEENADENRNSSSIKVIHFGVV